ncbi:MAG: hypothetical protein IPK39_05845 [Sulfuritalea sp.]|nr:hypothetical protein [Sulfuritalea sp.]
MIPYLDVRLVASTSGEIDDATLQSFATSGATLLRKDSTDPIVADSTGLKSWISLGAGKLRLFFNPKDANNAPNFKAGIYTLTVAPTTAWQDSAGAASETNKSFSFELVDPTAEVTSPFSDNRPSVDVHVANQAAAGTVYIDLVYRATPGAGLDFQSILDDGQEFDLAGMAAVAGKPKPIAIVVDDSGLSSYTVVEKPTTDVNNDGTVDDKDWYALLANRGVTQFRYTATSAADFAPGKVSVTFKAYSGEEGWRDTGGNGSVAELDDLGLRSRASSTSKARPSSCSPRAQAGRSTSACCRGAVSST